MIAGVDGCGDGWIAVVDSGDGRTEIKPPVSTEKVFDDRELQLLAIDVPIGLADRGSREADILARQLLRKRGCCVFPAPIRPISIAIVGIKLPAYGLRLRVRKYRSNSLEYWTRCGTWMPHCEKPA